ncbi:MAG: sugar-binding protein [Verrucomicrobiota bacterium]
MTGGNNIMRRFFVKTGLFASLLVTALPGMAGTAPLPDAASEDQKTAYIWESVGPGGGGRLEYPAISPHDGNLLFASSDMHTAYRSTDQGATWSFIPHATGLEGVYHWVFHPFDPNIVFADARQPNNADLFTRSDGVFRSDDAGKTWKPAGSPFPAKFEFDPRTGMGIGLFKDDVLVTEDSGKTWKPSGGKLPKDAGKALNTVFGGKPGEIFIAAEHGIFRPGKGGKSWIPCMDGLPTVDGKPTVHGFDGGNNGNTTLLYATVSSSKSSDPGIYISASGGRNWKPAGEKGLFRATNNTRSPLYRRVAVCRDNPRVAYVSMEGLKSGMTPKGKGNSTVYRTTNGGASWNPVFFQHPDMRDYNITDRVWTDTQWGWQIPMQGLCASDTNPDEAMAMGGICAFHTSDGGETWRPLHSPPQQEDGSIPSGGMPVMTFWGYYFDPHDPDRHYMAGNDFSGWRSLDQGATWLQSNEGNPWPQNVNALEFDPEVPGRIWGAASVLHDVPIWKALAKPWLKGNTGGAIFSEDYGATWEVLGKGDLPLWTMTGIALDPTSPTDARRLWLAAFGLGAYHSADGGKNWKLRNEGMDEDNLNVVRIRRDVHGRWHAITSMKRGGPTTFLPGSLYVRSADDAEWRALFKAEGGKYKEFNYAGGPPAYPTDFDTDPDNPDILYVSALPPSWKKPGGGIWKTKDGGKTWRQCFSQSCLGVTVDPYTPNRVFAGTFWDGLHVSYNKGETWSRIDNFPFEHPFRVHFNPRQLDGPFLASTFGAMAWRGTTLPSATAIHRDSIQLDGNLDDWKGIEFIHVTPKTGVFDTAVPPAASADDLSYRFAVCHDNEALYVAVEATDDFVQADSTQPGQTGAKAWRDDAIEIFLDGNHNRAPNSRAEEEMKHGGEFALVINGAATSEASDHPDSFGKTWQGATNWKAVQQDEKMLRYEFRLAWSTMGGEVRPGDIIGFAISAMDDDDGGDCDHALYWSGISPNCWRDESGWGSVHLQPREAMP